MLGLTLLEAVFFVGSVAAHGAGGAVAAIQIAHARAKAQRLLPPAMAAAVLSDAAFLGVRATVIQAIPLTGPFESLLALAVLFGILYLVLRRMIDQVWFGAVLAWTTLGMILFAVLLARPAAKPDEVAATPWAVAHASVMILAAGSVVFATANAALYLLASHRLKQKQIVRVLGRVPSMETLGRMNRVSLRVAFALMTVGVLTGLGLIISLGTGVLQWLTDGKVICIMAAWVLLAGNMVLDHLYLLKEKTRAYVTIATFFLVLVAVLGVTVVGATQHQFS